MNNRGLLHIDYVLYKYNKEQIITLNDFYRYRAVRQEYMVLV